MAADRKVSVEALTTSLAVQPLRIDYAVRFDPSILRTATLALSQATSVGGAPVLSEAPTALGRTYAGADGQAWYVPMAVNPRKSKTSQTPAVFIDHEPERWVLRVTIDLVRPPAVPETAVPLPISQLALTLTSSALATPLVFETLADTPVSEPGVLRRVVAVTPVDQNRVATALQTGGSMFTVTATVHYAEAAAPEPDPPGPRWEPPVAVQIRDHRTRTSGIEAGGIRRASASDRRVVRDHRTPRVASFTAAAGRVAVHESLVAELDPSVFRFPRKPAPGPTQPAARTVSVGLAEGSGIPASFDAQNPVYAPIFALVSSAFGVNPDEAWRLSPAGPWKDTGIPGRYYLLPTEYRLAYDVERQLPAMDVVLVQGEGGTHRVRVRFSIVPWFEATAVEALRETIVDVEGVVFPEFEVGGDDGATFHSTALLQDLGGATVTSGDGGLAVDTRGFEYVVEGRLEYYTLLTKLLAPPTGIAPGLDGHVRCTLKASADDTAPQVRDVPVRLRLDRPATDLLTARLLPVPPVTAWPAQWTPPLYAAVTSRTDRPVDVGSVHATLLVVDPDLRLPIDSIPATAEPVAFSLGSPEQPPPAPRADEPPPAPPYPGEALAAALSEAVGGGGGSARPEVQMLQDRLADLGHALATTGLFDPETTAAVAAAQTAAGLPTSGAVDKATWEALFPALAPPPPEVPAGTALVELTPGEPVDPRVIGAVAASFGGVSLRLEPATVLERVHELAASGSMTAALRVRSYQLQHPDQLPPELSGLFAIEVQIRRPGGEPVTVFLSRDEPEKAAQIGFTVADLLGGATPGAPTYEWCRRNHTAAGPGAFSDWETLAGAELFVTPAT